MLTLCHCVTHAVYHFTIHLNCLLMTETKIQIIVVYFKMNSHHCIIKYPASFYCSLADYKEE